MKWFPSSRPWETVVTDDGRSATKMMSLKGGAIDVCTTSGAKSSSVVMVRF